MVVGHKRHLREYIALVHCIKVFSLSYYSKAYEQMVSAFLNNELESSKIMLSI